MHASRRTAYERAVIRENRQQSVGTPNRQGGVSYFYQGSGGKAPTPEETAAAVQWARGVEHAEPQSVRLRFGADFSQLFPDAPVTTEASGPSPLRLK
jgi:hypothetical protein